MILFVSDFRNGGTYILDSDLVDFFGLSNILKSDFYGGPPSLPMYTVSKTQHTTDGVLKEGDFVLALTSPDAQLNHLGMMWLKFEVELLPVLQEMFKSGRDVSKIHVMTADRTFYYIPLDDLRKASIDQWETAFEVLFHGWKHQSWNTSTVKRFVNFTAHGEGLFVDKSLEKLCAIIEVQLEKCSTGFNETFWSTQKRISMFVDVISELCNERIYFSPAGVKQWAVPSPQYIPGEEAPFGKGWSRHTFSSQFLEQLQTTLTVFEKSLRGQVTLYFDPELFVKMSIIFKDVDNLKSTLYKIKTECRRRKTAVTEFETLLKCLNEPYQASVQVRLMSSSGCYSELQLSYFLGSLTPLATDVAAERIRRFTAAIFIEPALFLSIEENKNTFVYFLQDIGQSLNLEIDWTKLLELTIIDTTLVSWFSSFTTIFNMGKNVLLEQKKNTSFATRSFFTCKPDKSPLSKDQNEMKAYLTRLLEQGDPHATSSILRAMTNDIDYMPVFFALLQELISNINLSSANITHKVFIPSIHSGIIWPTVALTFEKLPCSITEINIEIIYNLFIASINSLLLFSSLQVLYKKVKSFFSLKQQATIETQMKKRREAEAVFECFFESRDLYGAVPLYITDQFKNTTTKFSYVFLGVFFANFIRQEDQCEQVQILAYLRKVLHLDTALRRVFMNPDFRKKPILCHFEVDKWNLLEQLGQRSQLVRVPRIPKTAVAITFSENFSFIQNEMNRIIRVQGHPHVARLYGFIIANDDHIGLLVEYFEGGSLEKLLSQSKILISAEDVLSWSQQAASGLLFLHNNQIVHGTVAPKRMMLNVKHDRLKMLVLGLSDQRKDRENKFVAPEIKNGEENTKESDIYFFGLSISSMINRLLDDSTGLPRIAQLNRYIASIPPTERGSMQHAYNALTAIIDSEEVVFENIMERLSVMESKQELEQKYASGFVVHSDEIDNTRDQDELRDIKEKLLQSIDIPSIELESGNDETILERLRLYILAMNKYPEDSEIKEIGVNALYTTLPMTVELLSEEEKHCTVLLLLQTMESDYESVSAVHCCAGLSNFEPQYFVLSRVIESIRKVLEVHSGDTAVQQSAASLLFSLSTISEQRHVLGICGGIELGASLLHMKIAEELKTWLYVVVWCFLKNVTDELSQNCKKLVETDVVRLFIYCFRTCEDKRLLFPMIETIRNVAQVKSLRNHLLNEKLVNLMKICCKEKLWEVGFICAQIIALLLIDEWTNVPCEKQIIEEMLVQAISSWDFDTELKVTYTSMKVFLEILDHDNKAAILWTVWTLKYLTSKDDERYCPMLVNDGFISLLENLTLSSDDKKSIELSQHVLASLREFQMKKTAAEVQTLSL